MQDIIQELNRWFSPKMYSIASFFSREYTKKGYKEAIQACFMLLVGISFVYINKADTNTGIINEPQRRNENTKAKKPWSIAKKLSKTSTRTGNNVNASTWLKFDCCLRVEKIIEFLAVSNLFSYVVQLQLHDHKIDSKALFVTNQLSPTQLRGSKIP